MGVGALGETCKSGDGDTGFLATPVWPRAIQGVEMPDLELVERPLPLPVVGPWVYPCAEWLASLT